MIKELPNVYRVINDGLQVRTRHPFALLHAIFLIEIVVDHRNINVLVNIFNPKNAFFLTLSLPMNDNLLTIRM